MASQFFYPAANFHRRANLNPVVVTKVRFTLPSTDSVPALRSAVEQFEEVLNRRNADDVKYEWADISIDGREVTMSIYWYDRVFFDDRHGAYLVGAHPFVFQRFGVTVNHIAVSHSVPIGRTRLR
jgi:hypothetical protein